MPETTWNVESGSTPGEIVDDQFEELIAQAEAARDKAQEWAENPEDDPVEIGQYSSMHWANKSYAYRNEALTFRDAAETSATAADASATSSEAAKDAAEAAQAATEAAIDEIVWTTVADAAALASLDSAQYPSSLMRDAAYIPWVWDGADYAARITANDPRYIAPSSDPTGASGAWVRAGSAVNTWAPVKWPSVDGSIYSGPIAHVWHRTGGYGTYGLAMLQLSDDDELPTGEFSVAITGLASAKNMTGGTIFGGWTGANSPNSEQAGHAWTAGAVVGAEINAGNRYAELGLLSDLASSTRRTVGVQVVPTWTPSDGMGPPAGIYHGSFGIAVHKSVDGHKWHTGWITSVDSIVAGGIGFKMRGGSVLGNAPSYGLYMDGYHTNGIVIAGNQTDAFAVIGTATRGINLANATLTNAILMAAGQGISWGTNAARLSTTAGSLSLSTGTADDDFAIYGNNFGSRLFAGDATGGVPRITFYGGVAPVAQYSTTGTATGFTAGSGTAVLSESTFTGNTGTKAYTIGDIVRALKLANFIASS